MSEKDALEAAKAATISHMRGLQTTPPPADLLDPKTPKAVCTVPPGPNTKMEDAAEASHMDYTAQTTARTEEIIRKAQILTQQLTKLQQQAAEIPGDGTAQINEYSDSKNCPNVWHFLIVCDMASHSDQTEPKC